MSNQEIKERLQRLETTLEGVHVAGSDNLNSLLGSLQYISAWIEKLNASDVPEDEPES